MHASVVRLTFAKSMYGSCTVTGEMAEKIGTGLDSLVDMVVVACGNAFVITFILFSKVKDKVIS